MTIFQVTVTSVNQEAPAHASAPGVKVGDRRIWVDTTTNPEVAEADFENRVTVDDQLQQFASLDVLPIDMLFVRHPKVLK